jgi:rhodanese-related sulfurtransferase
MYGIKKTMLEILVLVAVGLGLGFAVNACRAKGSIKVSKNYFEAGSPAVTVADRSHKPTVAVTDPAAPLRQPQAPAKASGHLKHDYQSISLDGVVEVFNDPLTTKGLNAFVDARNDQLFQEGHIPGAVQFDPYQVEQYLQAALEKAGTAEKIIVYCNGGDCEDSIFACRELVAAGVPYDSIYLFEGGWKEWEAAEMPIDKGEQE